MPILAKFEKQPADVQDFDIDFTEWLAARGDTAPGPDGLTVQIDSGLVLLGAVLNAGVAKIWTSGGVNGVTYKISATLTTVGHRVKSAEVKVKVKEY